MHKIDPFGVRLHSAMRACGQVCVGADAHAEVLRLWTGEDSINGLHAFCDLFLEKISGLCCCVKIQVSFFERFGSAGFAVLENFTANLRAQNTLIIADAKRGDISSSLLPYILAWCDPNGPFACDALTLHPYMGVEELQEAFRLAASFGAGVFVLAATSNRMGHGLQQARMQDGNTVANSVCQAVCRYNNSLFTSLPFGSIGVVLGAGHNFSTLKIGFTQMHTGVRTPVLAPGFGYQGSSIDSCRQYFGPLFQSAIVAVSRSVLLYGPDKARDRIKKIADKCSA